MNDDSKAFKKRCFQLCKRKQLNAEEKQMLIDKPHFINRNRRTLIHYYIVNCPRVDIELLERMLDAGHELDTPDDDFTPFHSYIENRSHMKRQDLDEVTPILLNWLIDKGCRLSTESTDITIFMLLRSHLFYIVGMTLPDWEFDLIKRIYDMGEFKTDLREGKYRQIQPAWYCRDVAMYQWFEEHFQIYEGPVVDNRNDDGTRREYVNGFYNPFYTFCHHLRRYHAFELPGVKEVMEYLAEHNPEYVRCAMITTFAGNIRYVTYDFGENLQKNTWLLDMSYKYVPDAGDQILWGLVALRNPNGPVYEWGVANGKIQIGN